MDSTDVAVIGGGLSLLACVNELAASGVRATACMSTPFQEFALAACIFIADPAQHSSWVAQPSALKKPGVNYVYDAVVKVDPEAKVITFAKSPQLSYKALVVATGSRCPLISPAPGSSLAQRQDELAAAGQALAAAKTVVINGPGLVGIELAGDIRLKHPGADIVLLSRSGTILNSDPFPASQLKAVMDRLKAINVRLVKGKAPSDPEWMEYKLTNGTIPLTDGDAPELKFDVYIPSFAQRPNTHFLDHTDALNDRKQIIANECLQSTVYPEIFGINTTDKPPLGHPMTSRLKAQAMTCAANARRVLSGDAPVAHVDKMFPPAAPIPPNVKVGHGRGGWIQWSTSVLPTPISVCCCVPCGGGFPFCPPPCCWCIPGCASLCGTCGRGPSGAGSSEFIVTTLLPTAAKQMGFGKIGVGTAPPMVPPPQQDAFQKHE